MGLHKQVKRKIFLKITANSQIYSMANAFKKVAPRISLIIINLKKVVVL